MVNRGSCRHCKKDYRNVENIDKEIYRNQDGKWCSTCSGCKKEQSYTRKDHAKQSSAADWRCKTCRATEKSFSSNQRAGAFMRCFNKFKNSAKNRGISWDVSFEDFCSIYTGYCALTNWAISLEYKKTTASLDRIDSSKGYYMGNIRWVHSMVNMSKNKFSDESFVAMCLAVAQVRTSTVKS